METTPPANIIDIKVVRIDMNRGVHKDIYPSGLNFILPFGFQQMYVLPKDIQVLEITASSPRLNPF
jgi:hypothetical protein